MAKHRQPGRTLFTADTHFDHMGQALRRGFENVADHDRTLIQNWNAIVGPHDTVHIVGDVAAYCPNGYAQGVFERLDERKIVTIGTHEKTGRLVATASRNLYSRGQSPSS